ncbi:MAG: capsule biosynthesis protein [Sphingomonas sp.]
MPIGTRVARLWRDTRRRRIAYGAAALALAILCLVPRPYVARAKIVPQDASSLGLSSSLNAAGGQLQGFAALLGGAKPPIDLYLAIGRGGEASDAVIARLGLVGPGRYADRAAAERALARKVDIHSLTGGILEITARTRDPQEAERLTAAYVQAIGDRIGLLGRDRVRRKREVVEHRFKEAAARVSASETALNDFRRRNRLAEPEAQLGSELTLRAGLQAQLQAKLVELETLQRFQGDENPQLQSVQSEVASLRAQIGRTNAPAAGSAGPNVAGISEITGAYLDLYRDYRFAQALYEVYARSTEEVAVDALAAETASDVQVIEAPRLDPDRKYNIPAVALLLLILAAAAFTEIYAPATGLRLFREDADR